MNVTLSSRHAVHAATVSNTPLCPAKGDGFRVTATSVTCKACLKLLAAEAEKEAAFQRRLESSMMPATEGDDLGYVAPAEAADEQPAEIIEIREGARDAAEDAARDAALYRAAAKLAEPVAAEAPQCTCECTWQCERPADEPCTCPCTCGATAVAFDAEAVDAAHAEALAYLDQVSVPTGDEIQRELEAKVVMPRLCRCGHTAHVYGTCYLGASCGCADYRPCGLEAVHHQRTDSWGVRKAGTTETTWLPWLPGRGDIARRARVRMIRDIVVQKLNA